MGQIWGDEDCLFLNVYAPGDAQAKDALPVMVWIHGGGNSSGHSGFYDGSKLAQAESVVVVTLNYRLGPLGWFHHAALGEKAPRTAPGTMAPSISWQRCAGCKPASTPLGAIRRRSRSSGSRPGARIFRLSSSPPARRGLFRGAIEQSGGHGSVSLAEASHLTDDPEPGMNGSSGEVALTLLAQGDPACDRACAKARLAGADLEALGQQLRALTVAELFALYGSDVLGPNNPAVLRDGTVLPETPSSSALPMPARAPPFP